MPKQHRYKRISGREDRFNLRKLKFTISEMNKIALVAESIEDEALNHLEGHEKIQQCYRDLNKVVEGEVLPGKKFNELATSTSSLHDLYGYNVLSYGYPVPNAMLARTQYFSRDVEIITKFLHGSHRAYKRYSPVTDSLLADNRSNMRYIDASKVLPWYGKDIDQWKSMSLYDAIAGTILRMHYFLEKNRYFDIASIAKKMELSHVIDVIRQKLFTDHIFYQFQEQYFSYHSEEMMAYAVLYAFQDLPQLSSYMHVTLPEHVHRRIDTLIHDEIIAPFNHIINGNIKAGGALPTRSKGNIIDGCTGVLRKLDIQAEALKHRITETLTVESIKAKGRKKNLLWIDTADLESPSASRKLLAASDIQGNFSKFIQDAKLGEAIYDKVAQDLPNCPMPFHGMCSVGIRLKAAAAAQLLADREKNMLILPDNLFEFKKMKYMQEEEIKACEQVSQKTGAMLKHLITFHDLAQSCPTVIGILNAWLSYFEEIYQYRGCGVDSVDKLLFPVFFFSDIHFQQMIAHEDEWFCNAWINIRNLLKPLPDYVKKRDWRRVKKEVIDGIFREMLTMNLRTVSGEKNNGDSGQISNPMERKSIDPFSPPETHFSYDTMLVEDVSAPFEIVVAPPGNPAKYRSIVELNQPHIRKLKRLSSIPMSPRGMIRRFSRSGPLFDELRLDQYQHCELVFSTVQYRNMPVPGGREQVVTLFDFSGSMGSSRVWAAKNVSVTISEGLKHCDVMLYLYNTNGQFYRLTEIYNSQQKLIGQNGLASITMPGTDSGTGWNPDAAALLAMNEIIEKKTGKRKTVFIHISDHEWCKSLDNSKFTSTLGEMEYAVNRLIDNGHRYIAARIGTDADPFSESDLPHHYIHFPEGPITDNKIEELYKILVQATE